MRNITIFQQTHIDLMKSKVIFGELIPKPMFSIRHMQYNKYFIDL